MLKWYQEPLLHFIALGTIIFFITTMYDDDIFNDSSKKIVVSKEKIEEFITFWEGKYNTLPTSKELDTLIKYFIENEILYQEAVKMKLDKNNQAIKNLMIEKLKLIKQTPKQLSNLSDKKLKQYFNKNKKLFQTESDISISFRHIYFNPTQDVNAAMKAKEVYLSLKDKPYSNGSSKLGDSFYAGEYFNKISEKKLTKYFSSSFIKELKRLPLNTWSKPINSGFGIHLIFIQDIQRSKKIFHTIKEKIRNSYIIHQSDLAYKRFYKKAKHEYNIIIAPHSLHYKE